MKNPLVIGDKVFKYKKDALQYYKSILNTYNFNEFLSDNHYYDLIDLLVYDESFDEENQSDDSDCESEDSTNTEELNQDLIIENIKVAKVQFNTKCFEVIWSDGESYYISYLQIINRHKFNPNQSFNIACRNSIYIDIIAVKQRYFDNHSKKGYVKCQETGAMSKWEELVVDHRQPNTFSIIVDRFKELKQLDMNGIEYSVNANNQLIFNNKALEEDFIIYHKLKANLRIVKKENNSSRTGMARVKQSSKDLKIE